MLFKIRDESYCIYLESKKLVSHSRKLVLSDINNVPQKTIEMIDKKYVCCGFIKLYKQLQLTIANIIDRKVSCGTTDCSIFILLSRFLDLLLAFVYFQSYNEFITKSNNRNFKGPRLILLEIVNLYKIRFLKYLRYLSYFIIKNINLIGGNIENRYNNA